jgi:hypothetical protein
LMVPKCWHPALGPAQGLTYDRAATGVTVHLCDVFALGALVTPGDYRMAALHATDRSARGDHLVALHSGFDSLSVT